jgi:hypothetical protein
MPGDEYKRQYRDIVSSTSDRDRLDMLSGLLIEATENLSGVHKAYFLCHVLQSSSELVEAEYDMMFNHVMDYLRHAATGQILLLSGIDLEFARSIAICPYAYLPQKYFTKLIEWLEKEKMPEGNIYSIAMAICLGLADMQRSEWGIDILERIIPLSLKGINDSGQRRQVVEQVVGTLGTWGVRNEASKFVESILRLIDDRSKKDKKDVK